MTAATKNIGECPDCGSEVRFKKMPYMGQMITCRSCNTLLEVVNRFPLELDWAEDEWDEAFDEYDSKQSSRQNN